MLPAAEPVTILREPPIGFLRQRSHEWDRKNPRDEPALWKSVNYVFERRSTLPRMTRVIFDELHRFQVRLRRDPRISRAEPGSLRRKNFQRPVSVPFQQNVNELFADFAVSIVHHSVSSSWRARRRCVLRHLVALHSEAHDGDGGHTPVRTAAAGAAARDAGAPGAVTIVVAMLGECVSVA